MKSLIIFILSLSLASVAYAQNPNSVSLLWEADTYAPMFYAGHSQPSIGSMVKVVALPEIKNSQGQIIKTGDLNFAWTKDTRDIASASGLGKNSLSFIVDSTDKAVTVKVRVKTKDERVILDKSLVINVKAPRLVLYEEEPLTGPAYHQAVGEMYNLTKPEVTMGVEPYYFSRLAVSDNKINYAWLLNGKSVVSNPSNPRQITFATPESSGTGENLVELSAENSDNILQTAKNRLLIKFGFKNSSF